jgi:hypothetical protein
VHQGNLAESPLSAMRESIFDYEYFLEFKAKIARLIMVETFAEPMYAKYLKSVSFSLPCPFKKGLSESKVVSLAC